MADILVASLTPGESGRLREYVDGGGYICCRDLRWHLFSEHLDVFRVALEVAAITSPPPLLDDVQDVVNGRLVHKDLGAWEDLLSRLVAAGGPGFGVENEPRYFELLQDMTQSSLRKAIRKADYALQPEPASKVLRTREQA